MGSWYQHNSDTGRQPLNSGGHQAMTGSQRTKELMWKPKGTWEGMSQSVPRAKSYLIVYALSHLGLLQYSPSVLHRLCQLVPTMPHPTPWASLVASQVVARTAVRMGAVHHHIAEGVLVSAFGVQDSTGIPWVLMEFRLWLQLKSCTHLLTLSKYFK